MAHSAILLFPASMLSTQSHWMTSTRRIYHFVRTTQCSPSLPRQFFSLAGFPNWINFQTEREIVMKSDKNLLCSHCFGFIKYAQSTQYIGHGHGVGMCCVYLRFSVLCDSWYRSERLANFSWSKWIPVNERPNIFAVACAFRSPSRTQWNEICVQFC